MPPTQPSTKLTLEDYLLFPDDGQRHELIDGEHYVSPSPIMRHQRIILRLATAIANHLDTHPTGEVFIAAFTTMWMSPGSSIRNAMSSRFPGA